MCGPLLAAHKANRGSALRAGDASPLLSTGDSWVSNGAGVDSPEEYP